jgi:predicted small lipoprotein YifL
MIKGLKYFLLVAMILSSGSMLTACGKKGELEKPAAKTEQPKKKTS